MSSVALAAVALILYLIAAVCYGAALFLRTPAALPLSPGPPAYLPRIGRSLLWIGIVVQLASIGSWCVTERVTPFASEYGTRVVAAWAIAMAFAFMDRRDRWPALGVTALTMTSITLFTAFLHANSPIAGAEILANRMVSAHVIAILASFALCFLASGCAVLYLIQHHQLKSHAGGRLFRMLPPLATLDSLAYHAVAYALPLLTLGLVLGIAQALEEPAGKPVAAWLTDPHTLTAFGAWFCYLAYLTARLLIGWRGVRLQYLLLVALLVTLALYTVPTSTHRFI
ncbi:MAG: cytochrome c biogenesis protein CcsA [Chloroherpetonaceae bacterium]|nr:cytochrome c biogenesis protein [Chthonomonadaceae bacterium]MDW8209011.1 cytochrome c biogenesis protein CcsA [Chloroherpetonaceae bacterium]